jgi:hypothetical protein
MKGAFLTQMWRSGYGQTGPFKEAAGYDVIIEGEAGLMHMSVLRLVRCSHGIHEVISLTL